LSFLVSQAITNPCCDENYNKEKLILSLIKDDLINTCLIQKLQGIGLYTDYYSLHLSITVFELMGFEDSEKTDEIYERYLELCERAALVDIMESNNGMERLAVEIYEKIFLKRRNKSKI
jgi:hypothetical protein